MNAVTPAREAARALRLAELRSTIERCLSQVPGAPGWPVSYDRRLLRLDRRIDALVGAPNALVVILYRPGACGAAERTLAEDAALDVADFLDGASNLPVIPLVLTTAAIRPASPTLPLQGANGVLVLDPTTLAGFLQDVATRYPRARAPSPDWDRAAYRPVPSITEAACMLFSRHNAPELLAARAGADALGQTRAAIARHIAAASQQGGRTILFVTGAPGAGKTLCGLEAAFDARGTFLTGNPTLVHVLREALARDAVLRGVQPRAARQRMRSVIQELRDFRDHHLSTGATPADGLVVIDEAQRCWSAPTAILRSRERAIRLTDSEPGHLLDIAGRREGAVVLCLLGGGQEIHEGEGGLAEWGAALQRRPEWQVIAPGRAGGDARQRLPDLPGLRHDPDLHLGTPIRSIGHEHAAAWVAAMLDGDARHAGRLAQAGLPFRLTRSLADMRASLRQASRGLRRAGLVASAQGKRLRAEGLGATLPHMDEDAVARWFLDRWPDLRSAGALEVAATEFGVQGLELDEVGLCWDGDLIRAGNRWVARSVRGSAWVTPRRSDTVLNRLNAYRVLLTRARHRTVIWVPRGDADDPTRCPKLLDEVAAFLTACGVQQLVATQPARDQPETVLL